MVFSLLYDAKVFIGSLKDLLPNKIGEVWENMTLKQHKEIYFQNLSTIIDKLILNFEPKIVKNMNLNKSNDVNYSKKLISHIDKCFRYANNKESFINEEILKIDGMSGIKSRHFFNNMCNYDDVRYLEIGSFHGSTFSSALYKNNITAVSIDNWSEFGDQKPREHFLENLEKYKGDSDVKFIEKNCWEVDVESLSKFNIYFYDGHHSEESQFKAIDHYKDCLDSQFILIVDDWNWKNVRDGTLRGLSKNNMKIIYQYELYTDLDNQHGFLAFRESNWHNGLVAFLIQK